jgi:hypothetical protein
MMVRGLCSDEPPDQDPGRAAEQIRSERRGGERDRNRIGRVERRTGKGLDADGGERQDAEIREAEENRRLAKEVHAAGERVLRRRHTVWPAPEGVFLQREPRHDHQPERTQRQQCCPPAEHAAQAVAHDRRDRVADAAAYAVRAVRMSEPLRSDVCIEHGKICGMEHAVADTHQNDEREQPVDAGNEPSGEHAAREQRDAAEQHRPRTVAVDGEPGAELAQAAGDVEKAHQRPQRGIAHVELGFDERKQRRQRKLEKVREKMCEADEADHANVAAQRRVGTRGGRSQDESCEGKPR